MKKTLIFILIFLPTLISAQYKGAYKKGDALNVLSPDGATIYKSFSFTSAKVANVPYGSKVVIIDNAVRKKSAATKEFKDFPIKGYWVKVKFNEKEGYVFDGYLSKLSVPDISKATDTIIDGKPFSYMESYIAKNFKPIDEKKCEEFKSEVVQRIECDQNFEDGTIFHSEIEDNLLKIYRIEWKKFDHVEAYWLAKIISIKYSFQQSYEYNEGKSSGFFGNSIISIGDQKKGGKNVFLLWNDDEIGIVWGDGGVEDDEDLEE